MSAKSYSRGYDIYFDDAISKWKFTDNGNILNLENEKPCTRCGNLCTKEGHDHCIKNLGKVTGGCCGHGVDEGYISFEDGRVLRGFFRIDN